jgi:PelA/Pel-15E family pectate lyase
VIRALAVLCAFAATVQSQNSERDTASLLSNARIAALPAPQRDAWRTYVERSRRLGAADRASMDAELHRIGQAKMTKATYAKSFDVDSTMTDAWFATADGRRVADNVLSFQTPSGGWSKHVDMAARARRPGESYFGESDAWQYIATLDNGATTEQIELLARAFRATRDRRYRDGVVRGVGYLLDAQFPNGCWPQVFPLQGGYHDAATFNDDAIVHALEVLRSARATYDSLPAELRQRSALAIERGVACILAAQIARTGWAQQHDPLTLAPTSARSYELVGVSGRESAAIAAFLMSIEKPNAAVVAAVRDVVAWFERSKIFGYTYDFAAGLAPRDGAGPIWARLYEIETNRPIFANRDGVKRYDWNELTDRRTGYAWYGTEPAAVLRRYARWSRQHRANP